MASRVSGQNFMRGLINASRNHLVLALCSFVLTGVLGSGFTYWLSDYYKNKQLQDEVRARAVDGIRDFTDLTSERRTRAALVASAIRRHAQLAEVQVRKVRYDDSYVRWNTKIPGIIINIEYLFNKIPQCDISYYIDAVSHLTYMTPTQKSSGSGMLTDMDICITKAYDIYNVNTPETSSKAMSELESCKFDELTTRMSLCLDTLATSLNRVAAAPSDIKNIITQDRFSIQNDCQSSPAESSGGACPVGPGLPALPR